MKEEDESSSSFLAKESNEEIPSSRAATFHSPDVSEEEDLVSTPKMTMRSGKEKPAVGKPKTLGQDAMGTKGMLIGLNVLFTCQVA